MVSPWWYVDAAAYWRVNSYWWLMLSRYALITAYGLSIISTHESDMAWRLRLVVCRRGNKSSPDMLLLIISAAEPQRNLACLLVIVGLSCSCSNESVIFIDRSRASAVWTINSFWPCTFSTVRHSLLYRFCCCHGRRISMSSTCEYGHTTTLSITGTSAAVWDFPCFSPRPTVMIAACPSSVQ